MRHEVLADLAAAIPQIVGAGTMNNGQACVAQTRVLLPRRRYREGVDALAAAVGALVVGDPAEMTTQIGPLVAERQRERVLGYVAKGKAEGARCVVGGGRPKGFDRGWFVEPTLFADVDNRMTIAQEEIFGPVLTVIPFDDEQDAIRIANESSYGLAGNVMSGSLERGLAVARRLRAGFISVNGTAPYGADVPFGGYKASGIGRQNGIAGFDQYTELKSVGHPVA